MTAPIILHRSAAIDGETVMRADKHESFARVYADADNSDAGVQAIRRHTPGTLWERISAPLTVRPLPVNAFYRPMRQGHEMRHGHPLAATLQTSPGMLAEIVRTCC